MGTGLAITGWLSAALALLIGVGARRSRGETMEVVARACHELRGPVTAARLGLQLEARCAERSPARLRAIDLELGRAALALDDLSAIGGRHAPIRGWERVDVPELLTDSVEAARVTVADPDDAGENTVEIRLIWVGAPASVWGNRLRLAQATRNLIANAVEHGGGLVEVRGRRDGSRLRVQVTDGGPGLPAPVAELIRRPRGGRGARGRGLAIAAGVAREHGGGLAAAPSERGARLVLDLPAAAGPAAANPAPIPKGSGALPVAGPGPFHGGVAGGPSGPGRPTLPHP